MKKIALTLVTTCCLGLMLSCDSPAPGEQVANIIPAPVELVKGNGAFKLSNKTTISYSDPSLKGIAEGLSTYIKGLTGHDVAVSTSKGTISLELNPGLQSLNELPQTVGISAKEGNPKDERYALSVGKKSISIQATAAEGIYRGVSSLKQLIGGNLATKGEVVYLPVLEIKDSPRYAWRSLSFDVSRSFFEVDEVKQVIDLLSLYKMNVLHMHLTDNQGWRIEIKKYPKLTEVGGFMPNNGRKGGFYTQEQFKEIVQYAADRFITIVPEIDMPGHTAAVFAAYPELKNAVNLKLNFNIPGQALGALDIDDPKTKTFVEDVLTEISAMTPGAYLHIGGDETFGLSEDKFIRFINEVKPMVHKLGKKMVGWQETTRADIGKGDLFQYWVYQNMSGGSESQNEFASMLSPEIMKVLIETFKEAAHDVERGISKNAQVIMSPSGLVYLDHRYAEESTDPAQEDERARLGMPGYKKQTIEEMYTWNPATFNEHINWKKDIAGIEAAIWCETIVTFSDLQFMLMPRLAGVAEKGWSIAENTNWDEYKTRLSTQTATWKHAGWNYFKSSLVDWK